MDSIKSKKFDIHKTKMIVNIVMKEKNTGIYLDKRL